MTGPRRAHAAPRLQDSGARDRIRTELDGTLFVEAGAGSGKTTELVRRVCALVGAGVAMRHIAAITFTEKAAAELRDRVRVELDAMLVVAEESGDPQARERAERALEELDAAAVGTLHSFAGRILSEHPVQAGIPPLITTRDEVGQQVAFERRWYDIRSRMLTDATLAPTLRQAMDHGLKLEQIRELVALLEKDWDLVQERMHGAPPVDLPVDIGPLLAQAASVADLARHCRDEADLLRGVLGELVAWAGLLFDADAGDRPAVLAAVPKAGRRGRKGSWSCDVADVRAAVNDLHQAAHAVLAREHDLLLRRLVLWLATQVLFEAQRRRASGQLEFHDLLVLARGMLRDPVSGPAVRASLQRRYPRLLLDEFQDTDPIQIELAVRIAAGGDSLSGAAAWTDVQVPPGSLFVVGDPKQSIYRFRRADIATYLRTRDRLGEVVDLTTNFRSTKPLLDWVNAVFGRLVTEVPDAQPGYVPLDHDPDRPEWDVSDPALGPAVTVLGAAEHTDGPTADEQRAREAADVAGVIARMLADRWQVDDRRAEPDGTRRWVRDPVQPSDICILVPARTSLPALEEALDAAAVPFRTEISSQVYSSREVRELLTAVRAVDDPSDELALVATLRSSLFGCGDDDLFTWKQAGGRWSLFRDRPDSLPEYHPVAEAITWLRGLARRAPAMAPSEVLATLVADRRVLESAVDEDGARPRHREAWRRVRFMVDQARAWSEAEHGSLREYLAWADRQAADDARVEEEVLPETDTDSVRIMTIHAAKGLQFPVVVLSGMTSPGGGGKGPRLLWTDRGGWQLRTAGLSTLDFAAAAERDAELDWLEKVRLLYVACTRAQSHLVASLHRTPLKDPDAPPRTGAQILASAALSPSATHLHTDFTAEQDATAPDAPSQPAAGPAPPHDDWTAEHARVIEAAALKAAVSATDAAKGGEVALPSIVIEGLDKKPRDLELPPWAKGRYGTAVGRAVHAALQSLDLADPRDVGDVCAGFALAEAVPEHANVVETLVRAALLSAVVRRAAARRHWKETYVGTVIDDTLVEGYVDLLYREDDGTLVVVDYKTDAELGAVGLHAYGTQVALYARALTDATGRRVSRRVLVACRPSGALDIDV